MYFGDVANGYFIVETLVNQETDIPWVNDRHHTVKENSANNFSQIYL
jgi:hypothetical protein